MRRDAQSKRNGMFRPLTGLFVGSVIISVLFFIPCAAFGLIGSSEGTGIESLNGTLIESTTPVAVSGAVGEELSVIVKVINNGSAAQRFDLKFEFVDGPLVGQTLTAMEVQPPDGGEGDGTATFSYPSNEAGMSTLKFECTVFYEEQGMFGSYWEQKSPKYEAYATLEWVDSAPKELSVDVNPGKDPIFINLRKQMRMIKKKRWKRYTTVLRLMVNGSSDFNATDAAEFPFSLCGPDGDASVAPKRVRLKDKDRDGNMDLILAFHVPELVSKGLVHADCTGLVLRGQTADGTAVKAKVPVEVVGSKCRKPWKKKYKSDRWKKKKVFEYAGKNGKKTKVVVKYRGKNCKKHKVVVIKRSNKNGLKKVTVRNYGKNGLKRFEIRRYGKNGLVNKVMWKRNR